MKSVRKKVNRLIEYYTIVNKVEFVLLEKLYSRNKAANIYSIRYRLDLNYGTK